MPKEYKSDDIQSLDSKEWLRLRIFKNMKVDYVSLIQGFVLERPIAARADKRSILIEGFFVNEGAAAKWFHTICENFSKELGFKNDVMLIKYDSGHYSVHSKLLSEYLREANYRKKSPFADVKIYFNYKRSRDLTDAEKFSFLLGHFLRFYKDGRFILLSQWINYIVLDIIDSFSVSGDKVETVSHFNVPGVTHIMLGKDSYLLEMLNKWAVKVRKKA